MIGDDGNRVFCTSQVLAPLLECTDDSEQLSVIYIVISLSRSESLQVIGAGVEIPIAVLLH